MYINDISQAVKFDLYLYADDSCLVYTGRDTLNKNCNCLCDWFVENKLSINFGEDKTKSIIFGSKWRLKDTHISWTYGGDKLKLNNTRKLNILGLSSIVILLVKPWL